jgi:uncharacterized integral membrane protein
VHALSSLTGRGGVGTIVPMAYRPGQSDVPLEETSEGVDKRRAMRLLVAGIAIIVAVVFLSQNNDKVELNFLMFSVSARLWVGLLATLVLGAVLGQGAEVLWERRKRRRAEHD